LEILACVIALAGDEFAVISVDLPHTQHVLLAKEVEGLFQTRSQDEGILIDGEPLSVSVDRSWYCREHR
jgi:hypothetical protein